MECPKCHKDIKKFNHKHDCAYGMPETHMDGSERFECPECEYHLKRSEAEMLSLKYILDV